MGNKSFRMVSLGRNGRRILRRGVAAADAHLPDRDLGIMDRAVYALDIREIAFLARMSERPLAAARHVHGSRIIGTVDYLFTKLDDSLIDALRERYSGSQSERAEKEKEKDVHKDKEQAMSDTMSATPQGAVPADETIAQQFARRVVLKVSRIIEVEKHPNGDMLYILKLDCGEAEPRTIVSSIVPYYRPRAAGEAYCPGQQSQACEISAGVKSRGFAGGHDRMRSRIRPARCSSLRSSMSYGA
jgi:tRNA-binding EMAP/Myf-like protein